MIYQMAYPKGNKSAEKWTEKKSLEFINRGLDYVRENDDVLSLADILDHLDSYPDVWAYLTEKFKENKNVFRAIKRVENRLERNIIKAGAYDKAGAMSIFLLKNKFGYTDKVQTEHSGEVKIPPIFNLDEKK